MPVHDAFTCEHKPAVTFRGYQIPPWLITSSVIRGKDDKLHNNCPPRCIFICLSSRRAWMIDVLQHREDHSERSSASVLRSKANRCTHTQAPASQPTEMSRHADGCVSSIATNGGISGGNGHRRWDPILGTYVPGAGAVPMEEDESSVRVREQGIRSHQAAMTKVMRREGQYDPIFWRDRVTGQALGPEKFKGRPCLQPGSKAVADALHFEERPPTSPQMTPRWADTRESSRDHVRYLIGDEKDPSPRKDRVPTKGHAKRPKDHVRSLMRDDPPADAGEQDMKDMTRRKVYSRTERDMCVANLINTDKASRIPEKPWTPVDEASLAYSMRSGEDVLMALHPDGPAHHSYPRSPKVSPRGSSPAPEGRGSSTPVRPARPAWIDHESSNNHSPSSPRPARPEWMDHEKPFPTTNKTKPATPAWLSTYEPPPQTGCKPRPGLPDYMDYSAVYKDSEPQPSRRLKR